MKRDDERLFEAWMDDLFTYEGGLFADDDCEAVLSPELDARCRETMEHGFRKRGRNRVGKLVRVLLAAAVMATLLFSTVYATVPQVRVLTENLFGVVDVESYPENSRERYIASLALKFRLPYEDAEAIARETAEELQLADHEELRYVTIDKKVGAVTGVNGYHQEVRMMVEVRYVYDTALKVAVKLDSVGQPQMYVPGVVGYQIADSEYNVDYGYVPNSQLFSNNPHPYNTYARISRTTQVFYKVKEYEIEPGGEVLSVKHRWNFAEVQGDVETYVMTMIPSDFE